MNQQEFAAEDAAENLIADLLSAVKYSKLQARIAELKDAACSLEIIGSEEQRTTAIAQFHLLKGKIDAFNELIDDHHTAYEQLNPQQPL